MSLKSQHSLSVSEEAQRLAGQDGERTEASHLLFLEDDLVEEVLEALVRIVYAQLLKAVELNKQMGLLFSQHSGDFKI